MKAGKLRGYAFSVEENSKPETAYFNGMMLRVMRSLEFVKSRPEWDGKTLAVSGGSQGGLQCLSAAGLDSDVTECTAHKPWCCDLGGIRLNRLRGWRPDFTDALGYYDPVNMAKRIHCKTSITSGLGDYVCPPSGESVLYNNHQGAEDDRIHPRLDAWLHPAEPEDADVVVLRFFARPAVSEDVGIRVRIVPIGRCQASCH